MAHLPEETFLGYRIDFLFKANEGWFAWVTSPFNAHIFVKAPTFLEVKLLTVNAIETHVKEGKV